MFSYGKSKFQMFRVLPLSKRYEQFMDIDSWNFNINIFYFPRVHHTIYEDYSKRTHVKFPIFYKATILPKLSSYLDLELFSASFKITKSLSP